MGRIKSTMVKRAAESLLEQNPTKFSSEFTRNKEVLGSSTMPSKPIRNKVAGYLARMVKMKEKPRQISQKKVVERTESEED